MATAADSGRKLQAVTEPSEPQQYLLRQAMGLAFDRLEPESLSVAVSDAYSKQHGLDPSGPQPAREKLFAFWSKAWGPGNMKCTWARVHALAAENGGRLRIWRSVTIDGDPVEGLRAFLDSKGYIGPYWSYGRDSAHPHEGSGRAAEAYLLEGMVDLAGVDWIETLASSANPDWVGEDEIRVRDETEVELVSMTKREGWLHRNAADDGQEIDLGELAGGSFMAGERKAREMNYA